MSDESILPVKPREKAQIRIGKEFLWIKTPYNANLVATIKQFPGRVYDPDTKMWKVPAEYEHELRAFTREYFDIEGESVTDSGTRYEMIDVLLVVRKMETWDSDPQRANRDAGIERGGHLSSTKPESKYGRWIDTDWSRIKVDGFYLTDNQGGLALKPNDSFRVLFYDGTATIRQKEVDELSDWQDGEEFDKPVVIGQVPQKIYTQQYKARLMVRAGAVWQTLSSGDWRNLAVARADYKRLDNLHEEEFSPVAIEVSNFVNQQGLASDYDIEIEVEAEEAGPESGTVVSSVTGEVEQAPTERRKVKVSPVFFFHLEEEYPEVLLLYSKFLQKGVEAIGGRLEYSVPERLKPKKIRGKLQPTRYQMSYKAVITIEGSKEAGKEQG